MFPRVCILHPSLKYPASIFRCCRIFPCFMVALIIASSARTGSCANVGTRGDLQKVFRWHGSATTRILRKGTRPIRGFLAGAKKKAWKVRQTTSHIPVRYSCTHKRLETTHFTGSRFTCFSPFRITSFNASERIKL